MELLLFFLLLMSAIFSGTEVAIFSLNRLKLRKLKVKNPLFFEQILAFKKRPQEVLSGILLGNEVVNISIGLTTGFLMNKYFVESSEVTIFIFQVLIGTILVVFFGDITPKIIASQNNVEVLKGTLPILRSYMFLIYPIRKFLSFIVDMILKPDKRIERFDEEDLVHILEEGRNTGIIPEEQQSLIVSTLKLDDVTALNSMTPKDKVSWVNSEATVEEALKVFRSSKFSRLPIYDDVLKEPIGLIFLKDFLQYVGQNNLISTKVQKHIQKPLFISSKFTLNRILFFFRMKRSHMAFVLSNNGDYIGLITLDDVVRNLRKLSAESKR